MTTQQIGYFLKLAEELNYTTVAQMFFITQPTLSKQIVNLENELKVTLFDRDHSGVKLTPAGKRLYEKLKPIFLDLMQAVREAQEYGDTGEGISIGIQEEQLMSSSLMLAINLIRHEYPDLKVSIHRSGSEDLYEGLELGKYDLVNMIAYPTLRYVDKFDFVELENEESYIAYAKNHLDLGDEITGEELTKILQNETILFPNVLDEVDNAQARKMFVKNIPGMSEVDANNIHVEQTGRPISLPIQVSSGLGVSVCNKTNLFSMDPMVNMTKIIGTANSFSKGILFNKQPSNPYVKVIIKKALEEKGKIEVQP